jgi:CheY-like chemotaxis protein
MKEALPEDFVSRRILIVDDNAIDRKLIQKTVEKIGHQALLAENGKIGYETARREKPDLILSDCLMPEMDGVDMCKLIKEDADTKNIPLIFLTGVDTPKNVIECFDMGVENYIRKPVKPKVLSSQIKSIFAECLST